MTRKMLIFLMSALLVLPAGVGVMGGQKAPKPPQPPALAAPPQVPEGPAIAEPPEPAEAFDLAEPPEPPEPATGPAVALPPGSAMALLGDGGTWLGVRLSDLTADKARDLKLPGEYGARVIEVEADSPAAKAGLAKDDVILEFGGERVRSVAQLQRLVRETPAGRGIALQVSRAGATRTLSVKLEEGWARTPTPHVEFPGVHAPDSGNYFFNFKFHQPGPSLGITGEELTRQLADYFGVKKGKGVLVREVKAASAAEKAGLKAGDVIVSVENTDVGSVEELRQALPRDLEEKKKINLTLVRDRHEQTVAVELEPASHGPLRRAERIEIPQVDLAEIKRLANEYRQQASQYRDEAQRYQREIKEQSSHWQQEARRALEEAQKAIQLQQRALKEQLGRDLRFGRLGGEDGVI